MRFVVLCLVPVFSVPASGDSSITSGKWRPLVEHIAPTALTADGEALYYATPRGLFRLPHGGRSTRLLLRIHTNHLAVDGDWLYFSEGGSLFRLPKHGGTRQQIERDCPSFAIDDHAYYCNDNWLWRIDRETHVRTLLYGEGNGTNALVILAAGDFIYWGRTYDVMRIRKDGKAPEPVARGWCPHLAADNSFVYFTNGPELWRIPVAGGAPVRMGLPFPPRSVDFRIAVDARGLYGAFHALRIAEELTEENPFPHDEPSSGAILHIRQ